MTPGQRPRATDDATFAIAPGPLGYWEAFVHGRQRRFAASAAIVVGVVALTVG